MRLFWLFASLALLAGAAAAWVTDVRGFCPWTNYFIGVACASVFASIMRVVYLISEDRS